MRNPDKAQLAFQRFLTSTMDPAFKQEFLALLQKIERGRDDIPYFATEMLGMELTPFQREFLDRTGTPRNEWYGKYPDVPADAGSGLLYGKNIAYPGNQSGKTVMIAIKHIHFNFYKKGLELDEVLVDEAKYKTLNVSPAARQTRQCYQYVKEILTEEFLIKKSGAPARMNRLHPILKDFLIGENVTLGELRFRNKSIMYSVPTGHDQASSLAGGQFGYISYDECSQSLHLETELGAKILSRLISYGVCLDLVSTAEVDSKSQQFYLRIVNQGLRYEAGYWSLCGSFTSNQFISEEQKKMIMDELLKTDKARYRQVVFGDFVSAGGRFFDPRVIERMFRLKAKSRAVPGRKYLMVSDWGMADEGDPSVHFVLDYTDWFDGGTMKLVADEEMKGGSPHMQFALARTLYDAYTYVMPGDEHETRPVYVMDAAALGGVTIKKLMANLQPRGFDIEKDEALLMLKKVMEEDRDFYESDADGAVIEKNPNYGRLECYYVESLSEQLSLYQLEDGNLKQDHVMTLMMGVAWIYKKVKRRGKPVDINPLASNNLSRRDFAPRAGRAAVEVRQVSASALLSR